MRVANRAAGIVVGKFGTAVVRPEELFETGQTTSNMRQAESTDTMAGIPSVDELRRAAGFIGSNLVRALNDRGVHRHLAVDDLTEGDKFVNLADCEIADYLDKDEFIELGRGRVRRRRGRRCCTRAPARTRPSATAAT